MNQWGAFPGLKEKREERGRAGVYRDSLTPTIRPRATKRSLTRVALIEGATGIRRNLGRFLHVDLDLDLVLDPDYSARVECAAILDACVALALIE